MEKAFLAKIDSEVLQAFNLKCKSNSYPKGDAIEALMREFVSRVDSLDFVEELKRIKASKPKKKRSVKENATAENASVSSTGNETEGRTTGV